MERKNQMFKNLLRLPERISETKQPTQGQNDFNVQRAFGGALSLTAFAFVSVVLAVFSASQFPVWQAFLMAAIALVSLIFDASSVVLIRRGQAALGLKILFWSVLITLPLNVLLLSGVTAILMGVLLTIGFVVVFVLFPPAQRKYLQFGPIASVAVMFLIDFIDPFFRLDMGLSPFTRVIGPLVLGLVIVGIFVLLTRQAISGNIRTKLILSFAVITLFVGGISGTLSQRSYRISLTDDIGNKLADQANSRGIEIATTIDREKDILHTLSLSVSLQNAARTANETSRLSQADIERLDRQWQAADAANNNADPLVSGVLNNEISAQLRNFQGQFEQHVEVFLTGTQGVSIASTNRTSDYNQADEEWWQIAYRDGIFIGQPEYDASSKTIAMNMAVAVRENGNGNIVGVLRTTVNFTTLTKTLATGTFGQTGRTIILLPSGQELRLNTVGDGTFELVQEEALPELAALSQSGVRYQNVSLKGISTLVSIASVIPVGDTGEDTQVVSNLDWRVATLQDEVEALQPVTIQTRNTLLVGVLIMLAAIIAAIGLARMISDPITRLNTVAQKIAAGDITAQANVETRDEVGTLAGTFNRMTQQLRDSINTLESRVADATHNLELAAEVGRSVSQVRALDVMLKDAAELIRSRFDLYYVQVYLTNPSQTALILQSGTGTAGAELVERAHQLPLNTASINGRAAIEKRSVVISDTTASASFKPNPLLPDTRSEMAIPLLAGEKVVGVLDLQSQQAGALDQDILTAFEALAGQLAIAIQNANLLAETEQAREEIASQARRQSRANWVDYMDAIHKPEETGFVFEQNKITSITGDEPVKDKALIAPIAVTGEALGNLIVEMEGQAPMARTSELVNTVAQQVARQIESLRLLDSAERYRFEAEEASRRITRAGWKDYLEVNADQGSSYIYDLNEVRPYHPAEEPQIEASAKTLPLKVRDETVGKLVVQGLGADDTESLELATAVAERLGAHIESLRQFEETQRGQIELDKRARQLAAVANVSSVSSRELDIQKMLETVVHLTQRQFGLYHAHVFTYSENTGTLDIVACGYKEGDEHEGTHGTAKIPLIQEQSLVARSARTRQPVIVNDVHNEPGWLPNPLLPDTASEMAVPLIIGDQVLGVLDVQSERLNAFSEEDANIYTTLASQVSTALQNARSFVRAQQQAERETRLNLISQKIQGATTVEAVLQIAARELGHALGAPMTIAQLSMKDKK
jgi:GAF domain-containing protein/HAMP domain-containing protein